MYVTLLVLHSWLRWVVVVALLVRLALAVRGWLGGRPWTDLDRRASLAWVVAFDTQLLVGVALYAVSPLVRAAWIDIGAAMKDGALRFWSVEHWPAMLAAVVVVHVGHVRSRRVEGDARKHRAVALACILAILFVASAFPWPGRPHVGRPWFLVP